MGILDFGKKSSASPSNQSNVSQQQNVQGGVDQVQSTSPPQRQSYNGIGNPQGGQSYSGIGTPPGGSQSSNGIGPTQNSVAQGGSQQQQPLNDTNNQQDANQKNQGQNQSPVQDQTQSGQSSSGASGQQDGAVDSSADNALSSQMTDKQRDQLDVMTHLTQRANKVFFVANNKAKELQGRFVDSEHLLAGLLSDGEVYKMLTELKLQPQQIQTELEAIYKKENINENPQVSPRVKQITENSLGVAREMGFEFISPEHLLLALYEEGEGMGAQILNKLGLQQDALRKKVTGKKEASQKEEEEKKTALEQFTVDLTAKATEGKIDPVLERSVEIERVVHILSRRVKNNPIIVGEPGVGKTALVEGLAQKIISKQVPESLQNKRILSLDMTSIIAGASHRGEFEERMKSLVEELKASQGSIILFIDEIHNVTGAGGGEGGVDAANFLKPPLSRAEIQVVGATTLSEYKRYIEKDAALERRFQKVYCPEPSEEATIKMLQGTRDKFEAFHKVKIPDEAIYSAVRLSKRYIGDRFLPDKAFDLIDEASAAVKLPLLSLPEEIKSIEMRIAQLKQEGAEYQKQGEAVKAKANQAKVDELNKKLAEKQEEFTRKKAQTTTEVSVETIKDIIAKRTGVSISKISSSETEKLKNLEDIMHKRLIGQERPVSSVAQAVRRGRAGLKAVGRPIGSFVFAGPSGVGKTELAKTLADILFGSEEDIHRFDMTEYMERHEVAKLLGPPPGYVGFEEGGKLTEAVRRKPYSIVLFDEVEKAHPDIFNILLQILDDGRLTDNKGRVISFKDTVVICTSNIGSKIIQEELMKGVKGDDAIGPSSVSTYAVTLDGKEVITVGGNLYEAVSNNKQRQWTNKTVLDYFRDQKIQPSTFNFPAEGFDTHVISPNKMEIISRGNALYIKQKPEDTQWQVSQMEEYFKGHTVGNVDPKAPEAQLPMSQWNTHAVFSDGTEVISYKDHFWKRKANSTVWEAGALKQYFQGAQTKDNAFPIGYWDNHVTLKNGGEVITVVDTVYVREPKQQVWKQQTTKEYFGDNTPFIEQSSAPAPSADSGGAKEDATDDQYGQLKKKVMDELLKFFRPELVNRFDEVIVFEPLQFKHMAAIARLNMKKIIKLMLDQEMGFSYTDSAIKIIAKEGFDPVFGARPMRRAIQKLIENPLSELIVAGNIKAGDTVIADAKGDQIAFDIQKSVALPDVQGGSVSGDVSPQMKKYMCETTNKVFDTEVRSTATVVSAYVGSPKVHEMAADASGGNVDATTVATASQQQVPDVQIPREQVGGMGAGA